MDQHVRHFHLDMLHFDYVCTGDIYVILKINHISFQFKWIIFLIFILKMYNLLNYGITLKAVIFWTTFKNDLDIYWLLWISAVHDAMAFIFASRIYRIPHRDFLLVILTHGRYNRAISSEYGRYEVPTHFILFLRAS